MIWKILTISAVVLAVIGIIVNIGGNAVNFGGTTAGYWNTTSGYQVNGSVVMDSSYNASTSALAASGAITGATTLTMTGESNLSTLVYGGSTTTVATTLPAIVELTAANFCDNSVMFYPTVEAGVGSSTTMYTPTAAALIADCIPAVGDTKSTFLIFSAADSASTTLTASTSVNLLRTTADTDLILESPNSSVGYKALITCLNNNGTEVDCLFQSVIDGD